MKSWRFNCCYFTVSRDEDCNGEKDCNGAEDCNGEKEEVCFVTLGKKGVL